MSDPLEAELVRDGRRWSRSFAAGVPAAPLRVAATTAPPLVRIRYRPDPTLFKSPMRTEFLPVCGRTRDLAAFHPHVRFTIENEEDGQRRDYHYPAGLLSLAQELEYQWWNGFGGDAAPRVWRCQMIDGSESAEAVFVRRPCGPPAIHSFVNGLARRPRVRTSRACAPASPRLPPASHPTMPPIPFPSCCSRSRAMRWPN